MSIEETNAQLVLLKVKLDEISKTVTALAGDHATAYQNLSASIEKLALNLGSQGKKAPKPKVDAPAVDAAAPAAPAKAKGGRTKAPKPASLEYFNKQFGENDSFRAAICAMPQVAQHMATAAFTNELADKRTAKTKNNFTAKTIYEKFPNIVEEQYASFLKLSQVAKKE